ncbi:MAG: hypothetical protein EPN70_20435 [Paraburkholderia sp.]|uniref:hypothetical protein n=1 Tax=Paraburkholderia sp. TaxID=1926495 RepID=UPI0011F50D6F|nr:hypothetical protein [Paraburkholderia sp.]TAM01115.1 MAG: hypothetical protein EPN70_20435 [Paraburkholderia sp.]TAM30388.1 MAG: hypothetical protein EPN59_09525 [Paraburkholderia sp.]
MEIKNYKDLTYTPLYDGVSASETFAFNGFEAKVIRYEPGARAPRHNHSGDNLKVVLQGELRFNGQTTGHVGAMYPCSAQEGYWLEALPETYVLLVQEPGTKTVLIDEPTE